MKTTRKKGLLVHTYCSKGDSTTDGPTNFYNAFVLIDEAIDGPFSPIERIPELQLRRMNFGDNQYIYAVPTALADKSPMFGGNFVWTSDSRLSKITKYPIPVHDRVESTLHFDCTPSR